MDEEWFERISMPALLRYARATYGTAMRQSLAEAGYDDIPANGLYVIGAMALGTGAPDRDIPLGDIIDDLGISKQSAGQLIDTLVARGYLVRAVDETDRRKLNVTLTERGVAAAAAQTQGRQKIDEALQARVGPENVRCTRRTLAALTHIGRADDAVIHIETIQSQRGC